MKNKKSFIAIIIIALFIYSSMIIQCYANSAEPPSILIIVSNPPDDLDISIDNGEEIYAGKKIDKVVESYYTFYSSRMKKTNDYILIVTSEDENFEMKLDDSLENYNNIFTLDLKSHILIRGKLISRSIFLVSMRVALTILIEAIIFWIFGFKNKKSWSTFLIINLITQGALNIWINGYSPIQSYIIFGLIFGEFFIFMAEIAVFLLFCKEHSRTRKVLYVLTANFISLLVGGYIISILPI